MAVNAQFSHSIPYPGQLTVNFQDESTGNPDGWLWDFGDGSFSSLQNPSHTFASATYFSVTLSTWVLDFETSGGRGTPSNSALQSYVNTGGPQDCATAWAWAQATNYTTSGFSDRCCWMIQKWAANSCAYISYRNQFRHTVSSDLSTITLLRCEFFTPDDFTHLNRSIETPAGSIQLRVVEGDSIDPSFQGGEQVGHYPGSISGVVEWGMNGKRGIASTWELWPVHANLNNIAETVNMGGWMVKNIEVVVIQAVLDEHDSITKSILFGYVPPPQVIIDFVGTPLLGTSPMEVDFTDLSNIQTKFSRWEFGDGNAATFAGTTHPTNTYISDHCSIAAE
jgi:PKD repeat protein